jgi:hypothetical protein
LQALARTIVIGRAGGAGSGRRVERLAAAGAKLGVERRRQGGFFGRRRWFKPRLGSRRLVRRRGGGRARSGVSGGFPLSVGMFLNGKSCRQQSLKGLFVEQ